MLKYPAWLSLLLVLISHSSKGELSLELRHLWNKQALSTPSKELVTASGERIKLSRFAYLLSGPRLLAGRT